MGRAWRQKLKKGSKCLIGVEFQILGPLAALQEGRPLRLGGRKQCAVLAVLLLHANELVPADRLVEEIWRDAKPESAARSLQVYVSSLRKELGESAAALQTRGGGYVIEIAPEQLDAGRFERLVDEGTAALADGDPERAATLLREALALWRGPALADLGYESFAQAEVARLEELRLEALETRIEAELALGRHGQLVAELEAVVDEHPLRERLRRQLMLALYRTGRQPDALQTYRDGRDALIEELGLEPSAELRDLQSAILRQDPVLAVEPPELRARRHLPTPATPLVGRRAELEYVHAIFRDDDARLATLTGPGGTGKTRLAVQAAWELAERFPDGVYFVDLASIRDSEQVPAAIARALDVREARGRPLPDTLKKYLLNRKLLLVLDNFEHLQEAAPFVGELLAEASGLKALVTSRSRLHVYGEHEYPVPPLTEEEALDLFAARARAVRPGFALDAARAHLAELCRRLDRLPLAIELAAALSRRFSPEQMLGVLTHPLELATHGPVDVPARQRTLRATIEWSHSLLDEDERTLFARLSVFLGGCTLEAAEEVCGADLETLASLVDNSLVRERVGPEGDPRFTMLETIREYALERLEEGGGSEAVRGRHAEHFLALAKEAEAHIFRPEQASWLERLVTDDANLNAARMFLSRSGDPELALELAAATWRYLYLGGRGSQARMWLEEALGETQKPTKPRVRALVGAGNMAISLGANEQGRQRIDEALKLARQLEDTWGIVAASNQLAGLLSQAGDDERAVALYEESLRLSREIGDKRMISAATANLGLAALYRGDYERAEEFLKESLALARSLESTQDVARMLGHLGVATLHLSRVREATSVFLESLALAQKAQFKGHMIWGLEGLAAVAAANGEAARAARLLGANDALAEAIAVPLTEIHFVRPIRERSVAAARGELGEEAFAAAMAEGREMALEEAVSYALTGSSASAVASG